MNICPASAAITASHWPLIFINTQSRWHTNTLPRGPPLPPALPSIRSHSFQPQRGRIKAGLARPGAYNRSGFSSTQTATPSEWFQVRFAERSSSSLAEYGHMELTYNIITRCDCGCAALPALLRRRYQVLGLKLKLRANIESGLSQFTHQALNPTAFNLGHL